MNEKRDTQTSARKVSHDFRQEGFKRTSVKYDSAGNHLYLCPVASVDSWSADWSFVSGDSLSKQQLQRSC